MLVVVVVVHIINVLRRQETRLIRPRHDRARADLQSTTYRQTAALQFTHMLHQQVVARVVCPPGAPRSYNSTCSYSVYYLRGIVSMYALGTRSYMYQKQYSSRVAEKALPSSTDRRFCDVNIYFRQQRGQQRLHRNVCGRHVNARRQGT